MYSAIWKRFQVTSGYGGNFEFFISFYFGPKIITKKAEIYNHITKSCVFSYLLIKKPLRHKL